MSRYVWRAGSEAILSGMEAFNVCQAETFRLDAEETGTHGNF